MFGIKQKCHKSHWLGLDLRYIKQVLRGGTAISDALIGCFIYKYTFIPVYLYTYICKLTFLRLPPTVKFYL